MTDRTKISWVTDNFVYADCPIIKKLSSEFDINWHITERKSMTYFGRDDLKNMDAGAGVKKYIYYSNRRLRNPLTISLYFKIISKIRREKPDIIYINMFMGLLYFYPLILLFLPRKKVVYAIHDVAEHKKTRHIYLRWATKKLMIKSFNNFQLFSETQRNLFLKKCKNKHSFAARLYTTDYGTADGLKTIESLMPINFLFFGSIRESKGLQFLVKAADRLNRSYKGKFTVTIAGHCYNWDQYEKLIEDKDNYILKIELIPDDEIPELFSKAHYIVLPYLDVTQSGVLMIAYQYQVPAIASDFEEFRNDIEDGKTGYLFEPQNTDSLYNVMEKIIVSENKTYTVIKSNLQEFINRNISLSSIADKYSAFFNSLVKR
ncbi:MAG: glycosyltransferase [Bacteroidetes bacterium]|nr:glycosyltransferase [Bacteroidota bacterium]